MTNQEVIAYIIANGVNGKLDINEVGQETVIVDGVEETHDFRYTAITLQREDITEKQARLQAELDEITTAQTTIQSRNVIQ